MGYIGMCRCEGYGFQAVYSRIGYINQRVQVQNRVSFSRKLINRLKILVQTREIVQGIASQKYEKNQIGFVLAGLCLRRQQFLENSYSGIRGWGGGGGAGFWEFSLVQGSKIHLNKLQYRLRVPGSLWHIPTQKSLKYPPGAQTKPPIFPYYSRNSNGKCVKLCQSLWRNGLARWTSNSKVVGSTPTRGDFFQ